MRMASGCLGAHPVRPGREGTAMERDPDRRAYAFAVGGGTLLWLAAMAASGKREAWDSGLYWIGAYPLAILLAAWLGYEFPRRAWRWGLAIMLAQAATLAVRSEEHTSELQSLMRISYAVFCLKKKMKLRTATDY